MRCNGLPEPTNLSELNSFLTVWQDQDVSAVDTVLNETNVILQVQTVVS